MKKYSVIGIMSFAMVSLCVAEPSTAGDNDVRATAMLQGPSSKEGFMNEKRTVKVRYHSDDCCPWRQAPSPTPGWMQIDSCLCELNLP